MSKDHLYKDQGSVSYSFEQNDFELVQAMKNLLSKI